MNNVRELPAPSVPNGSVGHSVAGWLPLDEENSSKYSYEASELNSVKIYIQPAKQASLVAMQSLKNSLFCPLNKVFAIKCTHAVFKTFVNTVRAVQPVHDSVRREDKCEFCLCGTSEEYRWSHLQATQQLLKIQV